MALNCQYSCQKFEKHFKLNFSAGVLWDLIFLSSVLTKVAIGNISIPDILLLLAEVYRSENVVKRK